MEQSSTLRDSDIRQIAELMQALERSGFDSLQIETADIKLALSKGETKTLESAPKPTSAAAPQTSIPAAPVARQQHTQKTSAPSASVDSDLFSVTSPIMGQFYRAPDPSSPPFVQVGSQVEESSTLGLIEVMKVFNAVTAGVKGTIVEICVEDAQTIDMGQVLFRIRPN